MVALAGLVTGAPAQSPIDPGTLGRLGIEPLAVRACQGITASSAAQRYSVIPGEGPASAPSPSQQLQAVDAGPLPGMTRGGKRIAPADSGISQRTLSVGSDASTIAAGDAGVSAPMNMGNPNEPASVLQVAVGQSDPSIILLPVQNDVRSSAVSNLDSGVAVARSAPIAHAVADVGGGDLATDSAIPPAAAPTADQFGNSRPVTILGYSGEAMEPFITRDGQYLFFNSSNQDDVDTDIYYASRIDDDLFQLIGTIAGVNTAYSPDSIGYKDAVPSMDVQNRFYFVTNRDYVNNLDTLYEGTFAAGRVDEIAPVGGDVSPQRLGVFNMDAEISPDGNLLYFTDNYFIDHGNGTPKELSSDIVVAARTPTGFAVLPNSDAIFQNVNDSGVDYAPSISADGLELFFTRGDSYTTVASLYVATRTTTTQAFGTPQLLSAATGYAEAPSISYDGSLLYYCYHPTPTTASIYVMDRIPAEPACFVAGTAIRTERGDVTVEELRVGDLVKVATGGECRSVVWIGRRHVDCRRHPKPHRVWPVRIASGAFGRLLPQRPLYLSPDHAVYMDGVLIPVKLLINGVTIVQVPMDAVDYYHVELPNHDVLLAEGLPMESYLDTNGRRNFTGADHPTALFPDFAARTWDAYGCAPLVMSGSDLAAARAWVNAVAMRLVDGSSCGDESNDACHVRMAVRRL